MSKKEVLKKLMQNVSYREMLDAIFVLAQEKGDWEEARIIAKAAAELYRLKGRNGGVSSVAGFLPA